MSENSNKGGPVNLQEGRKPMSMTPVNKGFAQDGRPPMAMTPHEQKGRQPMAMTPVPSNAAPAASPQNNAPVPAPAAADKK